MKKNKLKILVDNQKRAIANLTVVCVEQILSIRSKKIVRFSYSDKLKLRSLCLNERMSIHELDGESVIFISINDYRTEKGLFFSYENMPYTHGVILMMVKSEKQLFKFLERYNEKERLEFLVTDILN